jgi:hypothetical protein
MFGIDNTGSALDTVAHIIQVALTPVFLLSGIATLLNVFSTRLARVADRVDAVSRALESADPDQAKVLAVQLASSLVTCTRCGRYPRCGQRGGDLRRGVGAVRRRVA